MLTIKQYRKLQRRWVYIAVGLFSIWMAMLITSGILVSKGIINDTDQMDTFIFVGCIVWGVFCGWSMSGIYWWIGHRWSKDKK